MEKIPVLRSPLSKRQRRYQSRNRQANTSNKPKSDWTEIGLNRYGIDLAYGAGLDRRTEGVLAKPTE